MCKPGCDRPAQVDRPQAGGYNIYPREIDEVLYQHPRVADAVTIGIADDYRGETVKAFVVTKEEETLSEKEIIDFCREKLAAYKSPKLVEFREEMENIWNL